MKKRIISIALVLAMTAGLAAAKRHLRQRAHRRRRQRQKQPLMPQSSRRQMRAQSCRR